MSAGRPRQWPDFTPLPEADNEAAAWLMLEQLRWPDGVIVCPHCSVAGDHYFLKSLQGGRRTRTGRVTHRRVWKCHSCRRQFSPLVGTPYSRMKLPVCNLVKLLVEAVQGLHTNPARAIRLAYHANITRQYRLDPAVREREAQYMRENRHRWRHATEPWAPIPTWKPPRDTDLALLDLRTRDEVLRLVEEQKKDARRNRIQGGLSIDAPSHSQDGGEMQSRLGPIHFDREEDMWPYYAERGRRR